MNIYYICKEVNIHTNYVERFWVLARRGCGWEGGRGGVDNFKALLIKYLSVHCLTFLSICIISIGVIPILII